VSTDMMDRRTGLSPPSIINIHLSEAIGGLDHRRSACS
jgi:hypothetical protein